MDSMPLFDFYFWIWFGGFAWARGMNDNVLLIFEATHHLLKGLRKLKALAPYHFLHWHSTKHTPYFNLRIPRTFVLSQSGTFMKFPTSNTKCQFIISSLKVASVLHIFAFLDGNCWKFIYPPHSNYWEQATNKFISEAYFGHDKSQKKYIS